MKDAYYFSHDSNARNDTKILSMRCDYGLEGYGMYWMIVETLRDEARYKLKLEKCTYRALAMQMHSKVDAVEKFINDCIYEYELFDANDNEFWANSLLRRMEKLEDIREKRKTAANKRWNNEKEMQVHSNSNASAMQDSAKESKVKESKVKNTTTEVLEVVELFKEKLSDLPQPRKITDKRKEHINARIEEYGIETVIVVIEKIGKSDFLMGKIKDWKADMDWIFNINNFPKILEGKYDNKLKVVENQRVGIIPADPKNLGERVEGW